VRPPRARSERGQKYSIIVVSEGAKPAGGTASIGEHKAGAMPRLMGAAARVAESLAQQVRADMRVTVLGHLDGPVARVTALAPSDKDFFELPLSALTQDAAKQPTVWTVDRTDATVHARPVTVDTFSDTGVQVSAGLKSGDLVVVAGTQFMAEDMKVRLADKDMSRAAAAEPGRVTPDSATR